MTDYSELVKFLRGLSPWAFPDASNKRMLDAASAIETLQAAWIKSETDATNLTGKLAQAEADIDRLSLEIDKRIATEIELSNQVDALQVEVERLQKKLCDWCAVCPEERRKPQDCELLSEMPVMYGPSDAKMEVQDV